LRDRERSRLPETQDDAAAYRLAKQQIERDFLRASVLKLKIAQLENELYRVEEQLNQSKHIVDSFGQSRSIRSSTKSEAEPKRQFIRACPASDCKGFLSTAWKCGMCEQYTCPQCHELIGASKDSEHTCDPDKVASARLIEEESRPCPKCGARICKIDGCNQMWCTACNTGFDWRTGTLAKGPIHNPHFFQWLQRQGGAGAGADAAPANVIVHCDQDLDRQVTQRLHRERYGYFTRSSEPVDKETKEVRFLTEAWRMAREYADPAYGPQATLRETAEQYRRLRVRYLAGEIDTETWSTALQRIEKDELHAEAVQQVRDLYANAARDLIRGVFAVSAPPCAVADQVRELILYVNESFGNIAKRFGRKQHFLEIKLSR
jgi:hypothetical protein